MSQASKDTDSIVLTSSSPSLKPRIEMKAENKETIVKELQCVQKQEIVTSIVPNSSAATLDANPKDSTPNKLGPISNVVHLATQQFIKASEIIKSDPFNCQVQDEITDEELLEVALMLEAKNAANE